MNIIARNFDNSSLIGIHQVVNQTIPISAEDVFESDRVVKEIIDGLLIRFNSDPKKSVLDLKMPYMQKRYSIHCSIEEPKAAEFRIKEFAIQAMSPPLSAAKPPEVPRVEVFEEEIPEIPRYIECKGIPFRLSNELIMNMNGERDINHQIDPELLKWCLERKINVFRNPKHPLISLYFRRREDSSREVLNIVVNHHPKQEIDEFVVLTGYWMVPIQFKGRRGTDEYGFGVDYNQIPFLPKKYSQSKHYE